MSDKNRLPNMLKHEEIVKIFDTINNPKIAMACFMALCCGLRIREVCHLKVEDVDLSNKRIKIIDSKNTNRSKSGYGKDRYVPVPDVAISPIKKWLELIDYGKWFLPSNKSPDLPLRTKTLHGLFRDIMIKANLNQINQTTEYKQRIHNLDKIITKDLKKNTYKIRFHHLRHAYAQRIYENTNDLYLTSQLLGHSQVTTTQIYAKVSDNQKVRAVNNSFKSSLSISVQSNEITKESSKFFNPVEILKVRLAKGEIDFVTYRKLLLELEDPNNVIQVIHTKDGINK